MGKSWDEAEVIDEEVIRIVRARVGGVKVLWRPIGLSHWREVGEKHDWNFRDNQYLIDAKSTEADDRRI